MVGAELKRLREERNWSLRTLGARTHINFSYLSRIENGERRASVAVIEKLDAELKAGGTLIAAWVAENRVARPAQLPAAPTRFVGRNRQLAELAHVLSDRAAPSPTVITIHGPAGAGKTALALRCAHDLSTRFFDGQLYCDLGGFAASRADLADPASVLNWFCIALGTEPEAIPAGTAERAALYRSLLADRRVLVVLDNAADSRQVEHLLPGTGRCAAIVTSRRALSGLTALADAHCIPIGPLIESDAIALVTELVGVDRVKREPDAVLSLTRLCDHLPLALRLAAERVLEHPERPIKTLVSDLNAPGRRLDCLDNGDSPGIRSVISWSYIQLSTEAARMFRLLGTYGGQAISTRAAADLAGIHHATAWRYLRDLDRLHLAELEADETVRLHGLLRAYAREQALVEDDRAERAAALDRSVSWYLGTAREAMSAGSHDRIDERPLHGDALRHIVGIAEGALDCGPPGGTWQCAAALWACLLTRRGDGVASDEEATECAVQSGSPSDEEIASARNIAHAIPQQVPLGFGHDLYNHAIAPRSDTADLHGLAWTLAGAALVALCCDEDDLAQDYASRAQEMLVETGDPEGGATTLRLLSALQRANGLVELGQ